VFTPRSPLSSTVYLLHLWVALGHRLLHTHGHLSKSTTSSEGEGLKNRPWTIQFPRRCPLNNDYLQRREALPYIHPSVNTNQTQRLDYVIFLKYVQSHGKMFRNNTCILQFSLMALWIDIILKDNWKFVLRWKDNLKRTLLSTRRRVIIVCVEESESFVREMLVQTNMQTENFIKILLHLFSWIKRKLTAINQIHRQSQQQQQQQQHNGKNDNIMTCSSEQVGRNACVTITEAKELNSVAIVRERTILIGRPPLVGEVSDNFRG
jgi:hypothetical protein